MYVIATKIAAIAIDAAILVYTASAAGTAASGKPDDVKSWLYSAEPVAIACTTVNGILAALGCILGIIQLVSCESPGPLATSVTIGDGAIESNAGGLVAVANKLRLDKTAGLTATIPTGKASFVVGPVVAPTGNASVAADEISLAVGIAAAAGSVSVKADAVTLSMGPTASITMKATEISIKVNTNEVKVDATGVTINGTKLTLNAPQTQVAPVPTGAPAPPRRVPPPLPPLPPPRRAPPP